LEIPEIDWNAIKKHTPNYNRCKCGYHGYGHTKLVDVEGRLRLVAELPCPNCGERVGNIMSSSSDWEKFST